MYLVSRTLTRALCSSLHHSSSAKLPARKWLTSYQIRLYAATITTGNKITRGGKNTAAESSKEEQELARPTMIEYQPEIAKQVNLTGFVDQPVQFKSYSDGKSWAGTVISQRSDLKSSDFWIPIIFEGELAKIAAHHVKKDDRIHITGNLFTDSPPPNVTYPQSNVQIMVQNLNFVQGAIPPPQIEEMSFPPSESEQLSTKKQTSRTMKVQAMVEESSDDLKHLLDNPKELLDLDYHGSKDSGLVNSEEISIPLPQIDELSIKKKPARSKKVIVSDEGTSNPWNHLLENPKEWLDYRGCKASGLVKPKHPDFKGKVGGALSLWLNDAPDWVLQKLDELEFAVFLPKGKLKQLKGEEFWKDLAQNPDKWYDNRSDKTNVKAPDFKHKESGEALWMTDSPTWVLSKLPPLKKNQEQPLMANTISTPTPKQLKREESWKDLVQNPDKWYDNRSRKTNPKAPDFKHKDSGEALWMTDSPTWVLPKLPPLQTNQEQPLMANTVSQPTLNKPKREELWKDLVQNPDKWWDNRLKKTNAKAPDFKHKENGEALWMDNSPTWVLSKLPPSNQETPFMT
ncbi:Protein OSB3 [Hirschfeldia incana]|nr:Protein OSB3 [Hirschfeldia incana]